MGPLPGPLGRLSLPRLRGPSRGLATDGRGRYTLPISTPTSIATGRRRRAEYRPSWARVAEALVKAYNLHEGYWRITLQVGAAAGFTAQLPGGQHLPSLWTPIMGIVLVEADEPGPLTVDASAVNPRPSPILTPGTVQ